MIPTSLHLDSAKTIFGFIGAGLSVTGVAIANAMPDDARGWVESGGTVGLIACLIYAVRHLNAEVRRHQDLREKDRERMEVIRQAEHEANRKNGEELAQSLRQLSAAVEKMLEK